MKTLISVFVIALGLSGCASVPMADKKLDAQMKNFQIAPDKAGIYVYRNESMGTAVVLDVAVDGQPIGQAATHTYLYKEVAPGKHTVTSHAENTDTVEVDLRPGTLAFVRLEVKMGLFSPRAKLHVMPEAEGKKGVQQCNLATGKNGTICSGAACNSPASCADGIKDGLETDVDCGGGICPACAVGKECKVNSDCASANCVSGVCTP